MAMTSTNPATGETLRAFEAHGAQHIEEKLQRAAQTFAAWRLTTFAERSQKMQRAADILEERADEWALLMTQEMGKTLKSARDEVKKCAAACRYYAEHAEQFLADEEVPTKAARSLVKYQPLGPVLAVMPWNFPFWQVFRFAAPALMAGNVGLLKHASNVPQCALAIEQIFREAGFPDGAFQTLLIGSDAVEKVLSDERIRAATLTGSEGAGAANSANECAISSKVW